ncbi:hypothetical protein [Peribacillus asahii]|uniref:hypothetical protein n=1 Tax=Peribacillus asahii TaxID=228899 RepID=UPI00207929F0|nr:hypothetical protein [Peribacillus asahii]USK60411.1 hypothetical protein LIT37_03405 [Peribacillus asahii]
MAIFASEVTPEQISRLFESENFKLFHSTIRKDLDIEDIEYEIFLRSKVNDRDGYGDTSINARIKINQSWEKIDELILLEEGLILSINSKFSKVPGLYFERVIELCVKFALVHELVHVQQFKKGILTQEKMRELKGIRYEERDVEIEANNIATQIMSNKSEFDKRIISILTTKESVDNDNLPEILDLLGK